MPCTSMLNFYKTLEIIVLASNYFIASELLKAQTGPISPKARLTVDHTITTTFELTLGIDRDLSGLVGHDGFVVVEQELAGVKLVAAGQDGVGHFRGVIEGGGQSSYLTSNHYDLLGEESLEVGSGLVSDAEDLAVIQGLTGGNLGFKLSSGK